jgi:MSHA biogenesis protein MshI
MVGVALDKTGFRLAHVLRDEHDQPRLALAIDRRCDDTLAIRGALAAAVKEFKLEGCACTAVLSPELYSLRQVDPPAVEPAELREAARWSIKDLVDFSVEDALIDVFPSPEARGKPSRLNVVAARRKTLQQLLETLDRSGLSLVAIDIVELALRNVTALLSSDERGVALLRPAAPLGVLTLSRSGWLWFYRQLETDPLLLETAAEESLSDKLEAGGEGDRALEAVLLDIQRSLDYYEHQLGQPSPAELVITPGADDFPSLRRWLAKSLSLPVRALELQSLLPCDAVQSGAFGDDMLTCLGAALRGEELPA